MKSVSGAQGAGIIVKERGTWCWAVESIVIVPLSSGGSFGRVGRSGWRFDVEGRDGEERERDWRMCVGSGVGVDFRGKAC